MLAERRFAALQNVTRCIAEENAAVQTKRKNFDRQQLDCGTELRIADGTLGYRQFVKDGFYDLGFIAPDAGLDPLAAPDLKLQDQRFGAETGRVEVWIPAS